jgi:hypothetical protein
MKKNTTKVIASGIVLLNMFFCVLPGYAQKLLRISGKVVDEKGRPLVSATVFLSGSDRVTVADNEGKFMLNNIPTGTHQLSISMVGYSYFTQNIILSEGPVYVPATLKVKPIALAQVNIGGKSDWEANFKLFREVFLGTTENARACQILNPKVINFSTNKGVLMADADDFLVIENKRLGYKIRYMLKKFNYNKTTDIALYDGETSFEQLPGTDKTKKQWTKNRLETYKGSVMHFLRSIYQNRTSQEGFIVNQLYKKFYVPDGKKTVAMVDIDLRPIKFDTLINVINNSMVSFKSGPLYVVYNQTKAGVSPLKSAAPLIMSIAYKGDESSTIKLFLSRAIIDSRGSHSDYRDFFIEGKLAQQRVGDQLPFEYQPN